jgi:hypothetical protein
MSNYIFSAYTNEYDYRPVSVFEMETFKNVYLDRIDMSAEPPVFYAQTPPGDKFMFPVYLAPGFQAWLRERLEYGLFDWGAKWSFEPNTEFGCIMFPSSITNAYIFLCEIEADL